jgi:hypothetical protein
MADLPEPIDPEFLGPSASAGVPRLYVNAVGIRGGPFDLTLDLGFAVPRGSPDERPEPPEWLARVSMSWEHAVGLIHLLEQSMKQYEEQVGPLPDLAKIRAAGGQP